MRRQSPRITDSVASGVPSSCAAPEASRPMRTMCSSSAARWRRAARCASRARRLRLMRVMKITSSAALSAKQISMPQDVRTGEPARVVERQSPAGDEERVRPMKHAAVTATMVQVEPGSQQHGAEDDLQQVEEDEGIGGAAAQVELGGQRADVDQQREKARRW